MARVVFAWVKGIWEISFRRKRAKKKPNKLLSCEAPDHPAHRSTADINQFFNDTQNICLDCGLPDHITAYEDMKYLSPVTLLRRWIKFKSCVEFSGWLVRCHTKGNPCGGQRADAYFSIMRHIAHADPSFEISYAYCFNISGSFDSVETLALEAFGRNCRKHM